MNSMKSWRETVAPHQESTQYGGLNAITSNCPPSIAVNKSLSCAVMSNECRPAFARVQRTASALISTAVTRAPARAAHIPIRPEPHPRSRNDFPVNCREDTNLARIALDPKYRGWKTIGKTSRSKPSTRVLTESDERLCSQCLRNKGWTARRTRPSDNMRLIIHV